VARRVLVASTEMKEPYEEERIMTMPRRCDPKTPLLEWPVAPEHEI
jgi:hypothetical protein